MSLNEVHTFFQAGIYNFSIRFYKTWSMENPIRSYHLGVVSSVCALCYKPPIFPVWIDLVFAQLV